MRLRILFSCALLCIALPAFALDGDDELKVEEKSESLRFDPVAAKPEGISPQEAYPEQAAAVQQLIEKHVAAANAGDLEAYLDCFHEDISGAKLQRAYAERVIKTPKLVLELLAIDFQIIQKRAAVVHTRQRAHYTIDGSNIIDDAIITYRVKEQRGRWQIVGTDRKRLVQ
ncbi:MAG: nuclear transport factor 2 family protein [Bradymonadales bacterium]|jgi:hypothetical protein